MKDVSKEGKPRRRPVPEGFPTAGSLSQHPSLSDRSGHQPVWCIFFFKLATVCGLIGWGATTRCATRRARAVQNKRIVGSISA